MAGFSIVMLMMLLWPVMLVIAAVALVATAAVEFVNSPAFPCLVASTLCGVAAAVDVVRILWRRWRGGASYALTGRMFMLPGILCLASFALFVAVCAIAGSMLLDFFRSVG